MVQIMGGAHPFDLLSVAVTVIVETAAQPVKAIASTSLSHLPGARRTRTGVMPPFLDESSREEEVSKRHNHWSSLMRL